MTTYRNTRNPDGGDDLRDPALPEPAQPGTTSDEEVEALLNELGAAWAQALERIAQREKHGGETPRVYPVDIAREALTSAPPPPENDRLRDRVREAVAAEREACAKVALEVAASQSLGWARNPMLDRCGGSIAASNTGNFVAQAIRARSTLSGGSSNE